MTPEFCEHCTLEIPLDWRYCPHCCYRLRCPNVRKAKDPAEKGALELRYQAAVALVTPGAGYLSADDSRRQVARASAHAATPVTTPARASTA